MRLIHVNKIKEGEIIARDIISYEGGILLKRSSKFKEAFRQRLVERNIHEVYIEDELSKDIVPEEILSPKIKQQLNRDIRVEFDSLKNNLQLNVESVAKITTVLMEELASKNMVCDIIDLKMNDDYTYQHCIGVAILAAIVCRKMKIRQDHTHKIVMGALLHDIGKIIIPKDILNKPGKLTEDEYEMLKSHVEIGYKMLEGNNHLSPITKLAVLCHHEREDGSGYPLGKGEELHIGVKIVGACDVFHALISNRPYRQGLSIKDVIFLAQMEKINPEVRETIESILAFYPVGSVVLLNNGEVGIVEKNFAQDVRKPLVKVVYSIKSHMQLNYKLNLQEEPHIEVLEKLEDIPYAN